MTQSWPSGLTALTDSLELCLGIRTVNRAADDAERAGGRVSYLRYKYVVGGKIDDASTEPPDVEVLAESRGVDDPPAASNKLLTFSKPSNAIKVSAGEFRIVSVPDWISE